MDVLIRLDRERPPAGTVVPLPNPPPPAPGDPVALPFAGWLGLLQALAEVLDGEESRGR